MGARTVSTVDNCQARPRGWSAGAPGSAIPGSCARRIATGGVRSTGSSTSAFASAFSASRVFEAWLSPVVLFARSARFFVKIAERQVRYMIKTGRLAATKVADRWLISEDALPGGGVHPAKQAAHAEALQQAIQDGLAPIVDPASRRVWSV